MAEGWGDEWGLDWAGRGRDLGGPMLESGAKKVKAGSGGWEDGRVGDRARLGLGRRRPGGVGRAWLGVGFNSEPS